MSRFEKILYWIKMHNLSWFGLDALGRDSFDSDMTLIEMVVIKSTFLRW